jgi:hypothetical protein
VIAVLVVGFVLIAVVIGWGLVGAQAEAERRRVTPPAPKADPLPTVRLMTRRPYDWSRDGLG